MAEIVIDIDVKGGANIEKAVNNFTKLKTELKAAKGELANFELGTQGFADAQKKIQELQDSLGDLADATKIQGNGVERLGASFGLLKESLGAGDLDKAKLAFKGIGAAMDAIPIFLLIEGVKLLIENFEKVVAFFNAFTDSAKNIAALEKENEKLTKSFEHQKIALDAEISVMEAKLELDKSVGVSNSKILKSEEEIFLAKAKSLELEAITLKSKLELHKAKIEEIRDNDSLYESTKRAGISALELLPQTKATQIAIAKLEEEILINKKERAAEDIKSYEDASKRAVEIQAEAKVLIINYEKDIVDNKHEQTEKWKKSEETKTTKLEEELAKRKQAEIDRANEDLVVIPEIKQQQAVSEQEIKDRQTAYELNLSLLQAEKDKKDAAERKALRIKEAQESLEISKQGFQAAQGLSDALFDIKKANTAKDGKQAEKDAKLQFKINKGLAISSTIVQGAQNTIGAFGTGGPLGIARAIAVALGTAAAVAKIAGTQFESKTPPSAPGDSGSGEGEAKEAPAIANFVQPKLEQVGSQNQAQGGAQGQTIVKAFVVTSDITNSQEKEKIIEANTSF